MKPTRMQRNRAIDSHVHAQLYLQHSVEHERVGKACVLQVLQQLPRRAPETHLRVCRGSDANARFTPHHKAG